MNVVNRFAPLCTALLALSFGVLAAAQDAAPAPPSVGTDIP